MEELLFIIENENIGKRIDLFVSEMVESISRSNAQGLIEKGLITINNNKTKQNYRLRLGDRVSIGLPPCEVLEIKAENIPLEILYEDYDIVVINKPKGLVVHPAPGHEDGTLVNALMYHCSENLSGINGVLRPGIVHRIDKDTSGILVIAKNDKAHISLAKQLEEHSINRVYYAIVFNNIKEDRGSVNKPIGRDLKDRKKMSTITKGGRVAITHYRVLERFGRYTFIEVKLETGRTHQIRVHMSSIGHPILGDKVYGPIKQPYSLEGQTLHAGVLGFIHPSTGEYIEFSSPLPEYFQDLLKRLRGSI